jgi:hypothetical protein
MSSDTTISEIQQFAEFVEHELDETRGRVVEEALLLFRRRQEEIARLRQELAPALARFHAGEREPLDMEAIIRAGRDRLAREGIVDKCPE